MIPTHLKIDSERERIVYGTEIDWDENGMERIGPLSDHMESGIGTETFSRLIDGGYTDPDMRQNHGPKMIELLEFGEWVRQTDDEVSVEYTGYMLPPRRADSRAMITGLTIDSDDEIPLTIKREFTESFAGADLFERDETRLAAWWD